MNFFNYPGSSDESIEVEHSSSVLGTLSKKDWRRLLDFADRYNFKRGDILVNAGERDDSVYILVEGEVEVVVPRKFLGDKLIAVIPTGSVFGEMAFFDQKPRSATIRALNSGVSLKIERINFDKLFDREPGLGQKLLLSFGKVLSLRNRQMAALSAR